MRRQLVKKIRELGLISPPERRKAESFFEIKNFFWKRLLKGSAERELIVTIEISDVWNLFIKQKKRCVLTGWKIKFGKNGKETTASVDRIDSKLGYTIDNIQLVHKTINIFKSDNSDGEIYEMSKVIYLNNKSKFDKNDLVWKEDIWNDTERPRIKPHKKTINLNI